MRHPTSCRSRWRSAARCSALRRSTGRSPRLFLGDVGSLPIGLLLGWCLLAAGVARHLVAALLLPLYYLADATLTLLRRAVARRTVLGRAPLAFLPARHRQRLHASRRSCARCSRSISFWRRLAVDRRLPPARRSQINSCWLLGRLVGVTVVLRPIFAAADWLAASGALRAEFRHRVLQIPLDQSSRSSPAIACSSAASSRAAPASAARWACAAMMPAMPMSTVGSSLANRISFSRSPGPHAGEHDLDVVARLQPGQPDHALGQIDDLDRLAHVEHIDRNVRAHRRQRVGRRRQARDRRLRGWS